MEEWMPADLHRQSVAFLRTPHEDHNRRPMHTDMRSIRVRRARRRSKAFLRMQRAWTRAAVAIGL
jgi:hypothetical protein